MSKAKVIIILAAVLLLMPIASGCARNLPVLPGGGGSYAQEAKHVAQSEMAEVYTALLAGMANASVGTITAGTVTPADTSVTVSYTGGSFQLGDFKKLPTRGTWSWDANGSVVSGTYYYGYGVTCTYTAPSTWECT